MIKKIIKFFFNKFGFFYVKIFNFFNCKNIEYLFDKDYSIFFGYHDKLPKYKSICLSHFYNLKKNFFYVGYFKNKKKNLIYPSNLCSWQLGSSLKWLNFKNYEIIFNVFEKSKLISIVYNLKKKKIVKKINYPIYSTNNKFNKAINLDFFKLEKYRKGYGYQIKQKNKIKYNGIYIVYFKNNERKLLFSYKYLKKKLQIPCSCNKIFLNHSLFSPNDDFLSFIVSYELNKIRNNFLCIYNFKSKKFLFLSKSFLVSHYCWQNNERIIIVSSDGVKAKYYNYSIKNNNLIKISNNLNKDGHPMIHPKNKNLLLSDSYPNIFGVTKLFVYCLLKKKIIWHTLVHSHKNFVGDKRCDLHPRWNFEGNEIIIDCSEGGNRHIRVYKFY